MRLTLGPRTYDLTDRALVMGALGPPADPANPADPVDQGTEGARLVDQGADVLELVAPVGRWPVPVCVVAADEAAVDRALKGGADMVRLCRPTAAALRACAAAGVAVIVPPEAADRSAEAGLPPDRIMVDTLLVDVTGADCPVAATAAGVIRGARMVRTTDVRGARRVCDVIAALREAR